MCLLSDHYALYNQTPIIAGGQAGGRDPGPLPTFCRPSLQLFHKLISIFCLQVAKLEGVIQGVRTEMIQAQEASNLVRCWMHQQRQVAVRVQHQLTRPLPPPTLRCTMPTTLILSASLPCFAGHRRAEPGAVGAPDGGADNHRALV